jgi:hypothetical protein
MKMQKVTMISGLGLLALAGSAQAFVPWNNPNGNGAFFSWSNGGSDNGLFGSPLLVNGGNSFVFFPSNFRAESVGGGADIVSDRLQVTLTAFQGFSFDQILIQEFGDYGVVNGGSVSANMGMFVTNLNNFQVATDNDTFSSNANGFGNWSASTQTLLSAWIPPANQIQIVLNNNLIAISNGQGSVAFIEKKVAGIIITVPTPGSLALVGLGGLVAARRRR